MYSSSSACGDGLVQLYSAQQQQQQQQQTPENGEDARRRRRAESEQREFGESTPGRSPGRPSESPRNGASANRSAEGASGGRSSASAHANGDSPHASAESVQMLTGETIESIVEGSSYVLIFVYNAGVADRSTMHALARHFDELTSATDGEYRQWTTVLLDYHAELSQAKTARLSALLPFTRASPVCVLRKGARVASFEGRPSLRVVEEWLGALKMGEVSWSDIPYGD